MTLKDLLKTSKPNDYHNSCQMILLLFYDRVLTLLVVYSFFRGFFAKFFSLDRFFFTFADSLSDFPQYRQKFELATCKRLHDGHSTNFTSFPHELQ